MLIECKIRRKHGSSVTIDGITYKFTPNKDGAHVCEVPNKVHQDVLLKVREAFRVHGAKEPKRPVAMPDGVLVGSPDLQEGKGEDKALIDPDKASDAEVMEYARAVLNLDNPTDKDELAEYAQEMLGLAVEKKKKPENIVRDIIRTRMASHAGGE